MIKIQTRPGKEVLLAYTTRSIPDESVKLAMAELNMTMKDLEKFTCAKEALRKHLEKINSCILRPVQFQVVHTWVNVVVDLHEKHVPIENVSYKNQKIHFCALRLFLKDVTSDDVQWFVNQANAKANNSIQILDTNYFELVKSLSVFENTEFLTGRAALDRKVKTVNLRMSSKWLDPLFEAIHLVWARRCLLIFFKDRSLRDRPISDFLTRDISIGSDFIPLEWPTDPSL